MRQLRNWVGHIFQLLLSMMIPISHGLFLRQNSLISDVMMPRAYDPNNPSESCYNILYESDANGDGTVSNDEYQTFVSLLSNGEYNTMSYVDLPFGIKINFVYLNCLCRYRPENSPDGNDCCTGPDGGIFVSGAGPGELPTSTEEEYLSTVCRETQAAIDNAMSESSMIPVDTVTESPTKEPTTESPTSIAPSFSPSSDPTKRPTGVPSAKPITNAPESSSPSVSPTLIPSTSAPSTREPSVTPVLMSTDSPTSMKQTLVPTSTTSTPGGTQSPSLSSQPSNIPSSASSYSPSTAPTSSSEVYAGSTSEATPNPGTKEPEPEPIPAGGVAGIVLSSAIVLFAVAYIYSNKKRKREEEDDPDLRDVRNKELDDLEAGQGTIDVAEAGAGANVGSGKDVIGSEAGQVSGQHQVSDNDDDDDEEEDETFIGIITDDTLKLSDIAARPPPSLAGTSLIAPTSPKRDQFHDDSSSAGESGWSSSAGLSSLNTSSFDNGTDDGLMPGSPGRLLATIGVADAAATSAGQTHRDANVRPSFVPVDDDIDESSEISYDDNIPTDAALTIHSVPIQTRLAQGQVTREDLNAAIEAGDWAVVGATAALLADSTGGVMDMSISGSEYGDLSLHTRDTMSEISDNDDRAKELDRLVETGDWEGVVMAAAQFEGSLDGQDSTSEASKNKSRTSVRDKAEIRSEVERLVRRVVPDEIDNVDDMMQQFKGREEELVETLRTMQERSLAQRAKAAVHKTAKLEKKARVSRARSSSSSSEPSYYADSASSSLSANAAALDSLDNSISNSSVSDLGMTSADDQSSSRKTTQSSLELAIERGDWRAVGEAAAKMSSDGVVHDESGGSIHSGSVPDSQGKQDRVNYLDALISKGDWAGIVSAAGTYQAIDDYKVEDSRTSIEEREALAQAKMWQEIARQSCQSSTEAKGAVEATDWAISLERKRIEDTSFVAAHDCDNPDPKTPRMEDDESV